jgi:hypothetical protein
MIKTNKFQTIFLAIALSGCAPTAISKLEYLPPKTSDVKVNEVSINEPFDTVWDRLVGRLATGFFVINNIDKASRLINVSFSSDSPESYVDCGQTIREFHFQNEEQKYVYNFAQDSTYKVADKWGPLKNLPKISEVVRDTSLEGRINVYVAPQSSNKTKVSVNAKYILRVKIQGHTTEYTAFGSPAQEYTTPEFSSDVSFTTGQSVSKLFGNDSVTCRTTGELEKSILGMVRP